MAFLIRRIKLIFFKKLLQKFLSFIKLVVKGGEKWKSFNHNLHRLKFKVCTIKYFYSVFTMYLTVVRQITAHFFHLVAIR